MQNTLGSGTGRNEVLKPNWPFLVLYIMHTLFTLYINGQWSPFYAVAHCAISVHQSVCTKRPLKVLSGIISHPFAYLRTNSMEK